ncbi:MAG: ribbon-helix-helix protein, CopG family [Candidatus Gastranaerophilales bacterium]|nr:ribbon-helix-helix protein, CopG family [Candidatus Gastranaerophilales bacterium]
MMKEKIAISIDKDVLDRIRKIAEKENRTLSNFIETVLKAIK